MNDHRESSGNTSKEGCYSVLCLPDCKLLDIHPYFTTYDPGINLVDVGHLLYEAHCGSCRGGLMRPHSWTGTLSLPVHRGFIQGCRVTLNRELHLG